MKLRNLIVSGPQPFEPESAADLSCCLDGLDPSRELRDLIQGIACCSPHLSGLASRESEWLRKAWERPPEQSFDDLISQVETGHAVGDIRRHLRVLKRRAALLIAICDLGGVWNLLTVTRQLTRFADASVHSTLRHLFQRDFERGKLEGLSADQVEVCAGVFVLAMGKMGADELNYSSDIDLIVVSDTSVLPSDRVLELRAAFVRITRQMVRILSDSTADGYVFRTDLRLRPNPSTTPVCVSSEAAHVYYESMGRTWERAALIKARPAAGDLDAGRRFLDHLRPFIWRRHLDFATVDATIDMQTRIRQHKGLSANVRLEGHNIKLGAGGIRQIEFFAQTLQLITGGRDPEVREAGTIGALRVLARKGWVPGETSEFLMEAYREHRVLEHRLQMVQDIQTQTMPPDDRGMARIAALSGYEDVSEFRSVVSARLTQVNEVCSRFFERDSESDDEDFDVDEFLLEASENWLSLPVLRTQSAAHAFDRLRPKILSRLGRANEPQKAVARFDEFLRGLPSGVQLFSLFEANPRLLDLLIDICSAAPSLAGYLAQNAVVLDALFEPSFFEQLEGSDELLEDLVIQLATIPDYESRLNATRIWMHKKHFRIGVLQFCGIAGVLEAAQCYSDLAVACVRALLPGIEMEFAKRYGVIDGMGIAVLAMGKLGSSEMTATSDLDLVVVYDAAGQDHSVGQKPLPATTYFARLTQSIVTALSSRMTEGKLYNVDMRLRPSGRQGPVATSLAAFASYQKTRAWTWEHLALSRARVIAGSPQTIAAVEKIREEVLLRERDRKKILTDVAEMRDRIAVSRGDSAIWDVKSAKGGLLDIELLAQTLALLIRSTERHPKRQLEAAASAGCLEAGELSLLTATHDLLVQVQHVQRLLAEEKFDIGRLGSGGQAMLLSLTARETLSELESDLRDGTENCSRIIDKVMRD